MELLLALAVITAVIIFGALLSIGNERQRRAIDEMREQVVLWAIQDLRIKRERLAQEARVDDPLGWLSRMVAKVIGSEQNLDVAETFAEPLALVCELGAPRNKIIFSPMSPTDIRRYKQETRGRLSNFANPNPLLSLPRNTTVRELNTLNAGFLFDLELPLAWKSLTGRDVGRNSLWIYFVE